MVLFLSALLAYKYYQEHNAGASADPREGLADGKDEGGGNDDGGRRLLLGLLAGTDAPTSSEAALTEAVAESYSLASVPHVGSWPQQQARAQAVAQAEALAAAKRVASIGRTRRRFSDGSAPAAEEKAEERAPCRSGRGRPTRRSGKAKEPSRSPRSRTKNPGVGFFHRTDPRASVSADQKLEEYEERKRRRRRRRWRRGIESERWSTTVEISPPETTMTPAPLDERVSDRMSGAATPSISNLSSSPSDRPPAAAQSGLSDGVAPGGRDEAAVIGAKSGPASGPAAVAESAAGKRRPALVQSTDGVVRMGPPPPEYYEFPAEGDDDGRGGTPAASSASPSLSAASEKNDGGPVFRSDVRNEWIDAVFGPDFYPLPPETETETTPGEDYRPPRQGAGSAGVRSYVAYTAVVPANALRGGSTGGEGSSTAEASSTDAGVSTDAATSGSTAATLTADSEEGKRIGVTLSRIPLGLYVREVDAAGEAFAAGVVPGSVLVDVNGLGVLGEPSHKLLERMWQYEGHLGGTAASGGSGGGRRPPGSGEGADGGASASNGSGGRHYKKSGSMTAQELLDGLAQAASGGDGNKDPTSASSLKKKASTDADGVVALRLIYRGVPYTTLLLSVNAATGSSSSSSAASPPRPWGVSWAPCGNFALVQRSYGHAEKAGVRRGCLVAGVNGVGLRTMDHADAAMRLRDAFNAGEEVRIGLAYTPAASRCGYFERHGGAQGQGIGGGGGTPRGAKEANSASDEKQEERADTADSKKLVRPGSAEVKVRLKSREEQFARPHPLEYSIGSMLTCGVGPQYRPVDDAPTKEKARMTRKAQQRAAGLGGTVREANVGANGAARGDYGVYAAVAELAGRVAAGEMTAPIGLRRRGDSSSVLSSFPPSASASFQYKPLPPLPKSSLLDRYDPLSAASFLIKYHLSGCDYDSNFRLAGGVMDCPPPNSVGDGEGQVMTSSASSAPSSGTSSPLVSPRGRARMLKECASAGGAGEALSSAALQLVGMVSSREEMEGAARRDVVSAAAAGDEATNDNSEDAAGAGGGGGGEGQGKEASAISAARLADEVLDVLVDLAVEEDDALLQRLHYLLQVFLDAAEEKHGANSGASTSETAPAENDGPASAAGEAADDGGPYDPVRALRRARDRLAERTEERAAREEAEAKRAAAAAAARAARQAAEEARRAKAAAAAAAAKAKEEAEAKARARARAPLPPLPPSSSAHPPRDGTAYQDESNDDDTAAGSAATATTGTDSVGSSSTGKGGKKGRRGVTKKLFGKRLSKFKSSKSSKKFQPVSSESESEVAAPMLNGASTEEEDGGAVSAANESFVNSSFVHGAASPAPFTDATENGNGDAAAPTRTSTEEAATADAERDAAFSPTTPTKSQSADGAGDDAFASSPMTPTGADSEQLSPATLPPSAPELFENMSLFLSHLDAVCATVEKSLLKSFSQKVADWALQPWTPSKDKVLADVTAMLRDGLTGGEGEDRLFSLADLPLLNPVDPTELLSSVDGRECYILPSAHFPLLLSFGVRPRVTPAAPGGGEGEEKEEKGDGDSHLPNRIPAKTTQVGGGKDAVYRTTVEVVALRSPEKGQSCDYVVHAAVAGEVLETEKSTAGPTAADGAATIHLFPSDNALTFETRSSWGRPRTLSLRLSSTAAASSPDEESAGNDDQGAHPSTAEEGYGWVDLEPVWESEGEEGGSSSLICRAEIWPFKSGGEVFDAQGFPTDEAEDLVKMEVDLKVTTQLVPDASSRRMLLYKHDDDMRQEMLAIEYVETCDRILRASGLDLKLRTFRCLSVGRRKGFVEWVPGAVPMSEICQPAAGGGAFLGGSNGSASGGGFHRTTSGSGGASAPPGGSAEGDAAPQQQEGGVAVPFRPSWGWCKFKSLRDLHHMSFKSGDGKKTGGTNCAYGDNPVQDFLRSYAYDADAPYFIRKDAMDNYVKSCAGYSVITYLLGVGDRHLDNLLLHANGHFLHCDYSFILGQDPKTYLPMRITEEMVLGMGGRDSDNFAKFLSLAGAAFVALRRHSNVRALLSHVRTMARTDLPSVSQNGQRPEDALLDMRRRFRLDLSEEEALSFIERLIESSIASKLWIAVDAIHSLGKRF